MNRNVVPINFLHRDFAVCRLCGKCLSEICRMKVHLFETHRKPAAESVC